MASGDGHESDFKRIGSKEHNSQRDASGDMGPRVLKGLATPRSNPTTSNGINRPKKKSGMQ